MPLVLIEPPSHFASLKSWEEHRARLDKFSDEQVSSIRKRAADAWILHLREKEDSKPDLATSSAS